MLFGWQTGEVSSRAGQGEGHSVAPTVGMAFLQGCSDERQDGNGRHLDDHTPSMSQSQNTIPFVE